MKSNEPNQRFLGYVAFSVPIYLMAIGCAIAGKALFAIIFFCSGIFTIYWGDLIRVLQEIKDEIK